MVDHQGLAIELEGGVRASFTVHGLALHERRTVWVSGTRGEIRGVLQERLLEVTRERVANGAAAASTSGRTALPGHRLGLAAEEARRSGRVVDPAAIRAAAERSARV